MIGRIGHTTNFDVGDAAERAGARSPRAFPSHGERAGGMVQEPSALFVDYVLVAPFDPPTLAAAVRVGSTRLIDNVPLEEES